MRYRLGFLAILCSSICVLPCAAQSLITDISLSGSPSGIAVNPVTNRIYVDFSSSTGPAVAVVDGATNTVIDTISTPPGANVIAVNRVTNRVYTAGCDFTQTLPCAVTVIDGATDTVLTTVPVNGSTGIGVQGITVNPATNRIYVSDDMIYELEVINGNTNAATYIKTGNTEMLGLAADFKTNQIVGAPSGGVLDILNASTSQLTRVKVGTINQDVAVNPVTGLAYVTNNAGTTLGVVDLSTFGVVANVSVGSAPYGVCVDSRSNLIFVANSGDGTVAVVDGKTNTKTGSVTASSNSIDVNPTTRTVYATDTFGDVVHVISE